ncbi:hypothetical protein ACWGHM_24620 [Streptomyces sp. NPDC054904]|uniref:hypothetical protein n=1 Tax=unclassified Streptomyces TaxID=2593676 RepID=UPI002481A79A|nr:MULTISPECIES: hypothetical protein [unclassified Streptomyces]MDA5284216.1 hypothetical protein [Streptomyces sp. Isolate_45]MDX2392472.1 hypothetical protein [Streptomyces sp. DK15]
MTTNENASPLDDDIRPLDNHASGIGSKPPAPPVEPPLEAQGEAGGEEIVTLDNHASGTRP